MSEWIRVTDRLPELHNESFETEDGERFLYRISDPVLVLFNHDEMAVAMYERDPDDGGYAFEGWVMPLDSRALNSVTHWRPLPALPEALQA